ncbi:hypothetical protein B296_00054090 [Ensete ventricosum]|uniref:Uncharacterized protein n=1 Tax=Ensete ventricosum TaxID=4639 RepID=A0A426XHD0_ENSVE|nr:hypothetical protein B296_00054090 [Ensete ventricosum]
MTRGDGAPARMARGNRYSSFLFFFFSSSLLPFFSLNRPSTVDFSLNRPPMAEIDCRRSIFGRPGGLRTDNLMDRYLPPVPGGNATYLNRVPDEKGFMAKAAARSSRARPAAPERARKARSPIGEEARAKIEIWGRESRSEAEGRQRGEMGDLSEPACDFNYAGGFHFRERDTEDVCRGPTELERRPSGSTGSNRDGLGSTNELSDRWMMMRVTY